MKEAPASTTVYSGQWQHGQKHGFGKMTYPSGNYYEGHWAHGTKCGYGTMHWLNLQERYRGFWAEDQPDNIGEHVWFAGSDPSSCNHASCIRYNRYVGMLSHGQRHGEGTMLYSTGVDGTQMHLPSVLLALRKQQLMFRGIAHAAVP